MSRVFQKLIAEAAEASKGIPELLSGVHKLAALGADPEAGLFRIRKTLEYVVYDIFKRRCNEPPGARPLDELVKRVLKDGHLPRRFTPSANFIREFGNLGVHAHGEAFTAADVEAALAQLVPILVWYRQQIDGDLPNAEDAADPCEDLSDEHAEPAKPLNRSPRSRESDDEPDSGRVAPPAVGDIGAAIELAISDVDTLIMKIEASESDLGLVEIGAIIGEAIRHGAGIYNAGSFLGCARVYHHAAKGVLGCMPGPFWDTPGPPPLGERLAAEWLARIVQAVPRVTESNADDLAWELRWAFDSIQEIPLLDKIAMILVKARTAAGEPDVDVIREIVKAILIESDDIWESQRRAYHLRQTARILLWIADHRATAAPLPGVFRVSQELLRPIVEAHPRITRSSALGLAHSLGSALVQALSAEDAGVGKDGKWYDPRNWFRH